MGATEPGQPSSDAEDQSTSLPIPGLRTWRGMYVFVVIMFVLYLSLLSALGKVFSS